ncbi:MAG TPA: GntR family transcriptional regulator [Stellaceae bacterium]|jgi:DNA-binding GntR family transcriptional regulator|nr:GntR family transcriptional regulator [Stellaceae bacterium]
MERATFITTEAEPRSAVTAPGGRAEWLAGVLRERLWTGAYRPHEWIREAGLRGEFGLSNGPVREALQLLVAEGLLERVPYCGIRVVALSEAEIVALFQLRLALLETAAELAALRRDEAALATVPALLEQVRRDASAPQLPAPGHLMFWLIEASGNREIALVWQRVAGRSRLYLNEAARRAADPKTLIRPAEMLIGAIVAGKAEVARKTIRAITEQQMAELGFALLPARAKAAKRTSPSTKRKRS